MKKFMLIGILVISMGMLVGCSKGISQEEYDTIVAEKDKLQENLDSIEKEKDKLAIEYKEYKAEYSKYKTDYERVSSKYNKLATEQYEENKKYVPLNSWIKVCFGENSIYSYDNTEYLQCVAEKRYSISVKGLKEMWNDYILAIQILENSTDIPKYDKVAIKYLDNEGNLIIEIIVKRNEDKYDFEAIVGDLEKNSDILDLFYKAIE